MIILRHEFKHDVVGLHSYLTLESLDGCIFKMYDVCVLWVFYCTIPGCGMCCFLSSCHGWRSSPKNQDTNGLQPNHHINTLDSSRPVSPFPPGKNGQHITLQCLSLPGIHLVAERCFFKGVVLGGKCHGVSDHMWFCGWEVWWIPDLLGTIGSSHMQYSSWALNCMMFRTSRQNG